MKFLKSCTWITDSDEECGEICEGNTPYCASHGRRLRKEKELLQKQSEKRKHQIENQKKRNQMPRNTISKNPKDWSNTFLCSDGTRVTQAEINENRHQAYIKLYYDGIKCEGCGGKYLCFAHIIAQARCKQIGKTELIWDTGNCFPSCFICNPAIETPKGKEWKSLKNIKKCLSFIKQNDPELYAKFEQSAVNQETPTI